MLKIQVLGKGLIPRGFGIAPRREPFFVDYSTLNAIIYTGGLIVNAVTEDRTIRVTPDNMKRVYEKYNDKNYRTAKLRNQVVLPEKVEEPVKEVKEPEIYNPKNRAEVPATMIKDAVKNAADAIFDNKSDNTNGMTTPNVIVEKDGKKINSGVSMEDLSKTDGKTEDNTSNASEKKEDSEKKEEDKSGKKDNNGKNNSFRPVNNPNNK